MIYEDENGKAGILRVDVNTGEILQHYAAVYETRPYGTPSTAKEREHYRATSKCPASARRADEVEDYVKHTTDGRVPMVTINNCRRIFDMDSGNARIKRAGHILTKPQFKTMNKIVENLTFRNILIGSVGDVSAMLRVSPRNLRRTLESVAHLAQVYTARNGMARGQVKIIIPPWYGFRYPHSSIGEAYHRCCEEWLSQRREGKDSIASK